MTVETKASIGLVGLLLENLAGVPASTTLAATASQSSSLAARKNRVGSVGVTGAATPRLKASAGSAPASRLMALVTPVGVGVSMSQMSARPRRLDSAWQN